MGLHKVWLLKGGSRNWEVSGEPDPPFADIVLENPVKALLLSRSKQRWQLGASRNFPAESCSNSIREKKPHRETVQTQAEEPLTAAQSQKAIFKLQGRKDRQGPGSALVLGDSLGSRSWENSLGLRPGFAAYPAQVTHFLSLKVRIVNERARQMSCGPIIQTWRRVLQNQGKGPVIGKELDSPQTLSLLNPVTFVYFLWRRKIVS